VSIFVCWFLGFLYMMWPPRLIKPRWLQWLEKEYGYGLDILVEEAQKMGRWRWEARVHDQQGLESWAQEVLRRRQQDMDEAWASWLTHQACQKGERMFRKYRGNVPPDRLLDPYKLIDVPEHRNEDFHQYLMGPRQGMLFALIDSFEPGRAFTIADLRQACPGITDKLIRWVLDGFRARGEVECTGRGRAARWRRV
jgi:hypothetical protein